MAVSLVDIANRALTKLGAGRIISLDDDSQASNTLSSMFGIVRDAELRKNLWHFSKARAELPAISSAPLFGFSHHYQLPADFLRLIEVNGRGCRARPQLDAWYSIEGGRILINQAGPLRIRYARRVEDPNLFDALFVEALACKLAFEACETLTNSNSKKQMAADEYAVAVADARRMNAIERPAQAVSDDTWLESRY
ncbi:hypothetical protein [Bordetella trematum]|uniref:hypothetical protein n=1 Tax=Bordetella trematum TaxID=123899 RepID=UPI0004B476E0|nr:hypothetical protein [Bordetella trematum]